MLKIELKAETLAELKIELMNALADVCGGVMVTPETVNAPVQKAEAAPAPAPAPAPAEPEAPPAIAAANEKVDEADRVVIKAELDALKIPYSSKQRTPYLRELLARKKAEAASPKVEVLPAEAKPEAPEEKEEKSHIDMGAMRKAATKVEPAAPVEIGTVRDKMKAYAQKNGADKCLGLLAAFKAAKLSELKPDQLLELNAQLDAIEVKPAANMFE